MLLCPRNIATVSMAIPASTAIVAQEWRILVMDTSGSLLRLQNDLMRRAIFCGLSGLIKPLGLLSDTQIACIRSFANLGK